MSVLESTRMFASSACSPLLFFQHLQLRVILFCFAMTLLPFFVVTLVSQGFGPKAKHGDLYIYFHLYICDSLNINAATPKQKLLISCFLYLFVARLHLKSVYTCVTLGLLAALKAVVLGIHIGGGIVLCDSMLLTGTASHPHALCWCCTSSPASRIYKSVSLSRYNLF